MKRILGILAVQVGLLLVAPGVTQLCVAQSLPETCAQAKQAFDSISASIVYAAPWTAVEKRFGTPLRVEENKPYPGHILLQYSFPGCVIQFAIKNGDVSAKTYTLGAAALQPGAESAKATVARDSGELATAIASLEATTHLLQQQLDALEHAIQQVKSNPLPSASATQHSSQITPARALAPATPDAGAVEPAPSAATVKPLCAENGSCYGDISNITGRPKTVHVNGYYRKDGAYVRGYYRSK